MKCKVNDPVPLPLVVLISQFSCLTPNSLRASFSNPLCTVSSGTYFRYHQHQPSLTRSGFSMYLLGETRLTTEGPILSSP
jgi:hypothetical protein